MNPAKDDVSRGGQHREHGRGNAGRQPAIHDFLQRQSRRPGGIPLVMGQARLRVDLGRISVADLGRRLAARGIVAPQVLAEMALAGVDLEKEAAALGLSVSETAALFQAAVTGLAPEEREEIVRRLAAPRGKGALDPRDPDYERQRRALRLDEIPVLQADEVRRWLEWPGGILFLPLGPTSAVDHRRTLGPARNQGGRGTCTAFAATAVAESLEYLRDRRPGPRDFSEELIFWYSKWGQLFTAGGYGCGAALRHYCEYGSCEEMFFPYWAVEICSNHAHVPAPDVAMDRAHFYTSDQVVALEAGNADMVRDVLRSGRCVAFSSDVHGWHTGTGMITFPDPLDSEGKGGGHCTTIIGYIDRNDLPAEHEGGYFIVRNSWGGAGSTSHLMGPDYGGHLLMPYGWYRRYTSSACTLRDEDHLRGTGRRWLAEYFSNDSLKGVPVSLDLVGPYWETDGTIAEDQVDRVDFDWGMGGPFRLESRFPFLPDLVVGPSDHFSARFTQIRRFRPGWYRFRLRGDDGVRLWVDDRLVINGWKVQAATEYTREHYLSGGDHVLRVEYFERAGAASVRLNVDPVLFHFELFANQELAGSPVASFDDTLTDLEWRQASPVGEHDPRGPFSLRATAEMTFRAGGYRFHARHTGGCRIWIGEQLVLDDWDGTGGDSPVRQISGGRHRVRVEYCNRATVPGVGARGYYRAALSFGWSEESWQVSIYNDQRRHELFQEDFPGADGLYEAFRTQGLAGAPVFEYSYPADNDTAGEYYARDGLPLRLRFAKMEEFKNGIPGAENVPADWLGAHIRRRVFVAESGRYTFRLSSDDGYRLIVDNRLLLQDQHVTGADPFEAELDLEAGAHDIAIEYENTMWNGSVDFTMERSAWEVTYYRGRDFDTLVETRSVDRIERVIAERPSALGTHDYSIRCRRTLWLPLGRYRVQVRADDGVRFKIGGRPAIDAWVDQPPTSYWTYVEHHGGALPVEIEYYQRGGGAHLSFTMMPEGFFGEYYRGTSLQIPAPGAPVDRNVPVSYRFEPAIDFDWGHSGRLPRIGSDFFSARWSGNVELPVGRWSIEVTADDGVRLFLDGRLLIDQWHDQGPTTHRRSVDLVGRRHNLRLEYYEKAGGAVCRLAFRRLF
ncbi:PA14 domain-containing protein [Thermodesulfobacteriota bacterium B35]